MDIFQLSVGITFEAYWCSKKVRKFVDMWCISFSHRFFISLDNYLSKTNIKKFNCFDKKSSQIKQFASLHELCIEDCEGFDRKNCLLLASLFIQLKSFHFFYHPIPKNFIVKILKVSNMKLEDIFLCEHTKNIFSTMLNYCTMVTKLNLYNLRHKQVTTIYNTFNELLSFSFSY